MHRISAVSRIFLLIAGAFSYWRTRLTAGFALFTMFMGYRIRWKTVRVVENASEIAP